MPQTTSQRSMQDFYAIYRQNGLTPSLTRKFRRIVYYYYRRHKRRFPWRETDNPYHILISEVMLQQTQTSRVLQKYSEFISAFPDFQSLARATIGEVLRVWQGLGYNRRAIYLKKIAQAVMTDYAGELPSDRELLRKLPGIGRNTASAIAALAFNQPAAFIETNVRAVFLSFFFGGDDVDDSRIYPLVEATLDRRRPREWFYALYDYGAMLKSESRTGLKGAGYRKQSPFKGSDREIRGQVLRLLLEHPSLTGRQISGRLAQDEERVKKIIGDMEKEGFLTISRGRYRFT